jgi:hypothetical protein
MTSAANRAARPLTGASRNRPSHAIISPQTSSSSGTAPPPSSSEGNTSNSSSPHFLQSSQQSESLSAKLAREDAAQNNPPFTSSGATTTGDNTRSNNIHKPPSSRRVRWAETAAIASTMDTSTNENTDDDNNTVHYEPMDVVSEIIQRRYTLPMVLFLTTSIFLLVHFVGRPNPSIPRQADSINESEETVVGGFGLLARSGSGQLSSNLGYEDVFRDRDDFGEAILLVALCSAPLIVLYLIFSNPLLSLSLSLSLHSGMRLSDSLSSLSSSSLSPTTIDESSLVPTVEVIHHTTPKISPLSGISRAGGGLDPDYIVIPTSSGTNPGGEEEEDGNRTTLKFTTGDGGQ